MKTKGLLITGAIATIGSLVVAQAQNPDSTKSREELRALFEERKGALDRAVENAAEIPVAREVDTSATRARLEEAVERGVPQPGPEERAAQLRAEEQLARAKENLSEEGRIRIARPVAAPPENKPPVAPALPVNPVKPGNFDSAQPRPPERVDISPDEEGDVVRISSEGAAEFDSAKGIAIFTEDVIVEHPGFYLECDELEVHMRKTEKPEAVEGGPAPAPPADPAAAGEEEEGGIEIAIARGRRVMLKKLSEDGKEQIGYCKKAIYEGKTGNLKMYGRPQIQKGNQILQAKDESTVIIIEKDGKLSAPGKSLTVLPAGKSS